MSARQTTRARTVRVLVVDDSPFMRKAISRIIDSAPDLEVAAVASNGAEALAVLRAEPVDVVTLDVVMPGADGVETLKAIMAEHPVPVVMLSSQTSENAAVTFECLDAGAVDFIEKPSVYTNMNMPLIGGTLVEKLRAAAGVDTGRLGASESAHTATAEPRGGDRARTPEQRSDSPAARVTVTKPSRATALQVETLVIGASTGGPPALTRLLTALPPMLSVPIVIVQHMPPGFTEPLAERLNLLSPFEVKEARDGDLLRPGRVLVARAGYHLTFESRGERRMVRLDRRQRGGTSHMPSVDVAMLSAVRVFGSRAMGILLTGMGADGAEGMAAMRAAGSHTIAEAESSAVIFGMPRAAIEAGGACEVLDLGRIGGRVGDLLAASSAEG